MKRIGPGLIAIALASALHAQSFPPGYVDPAPLLAAAAKEIGEANLRCITYSGTGYDGAVGQTAEYNPNIDWHERLIAHDEVTGETWDWGQANYVRLEPWRAAAHVVGVLRRSG